MRCDTVAPESQGSAQASGYLELRQEGVEKDNSAWTATFSHASTIDREPPGYITMDSRSVGVSES